MYRNAVRGGPSHGRRQRAQKNFVKFGSAVFELWERTDRQASKQTNILITIPRTRTPSGGETTNQDSCPTDFRGHR